MQISLRELDMSIGALRELSVVPLPLKTAYRIKKSIKVLSDEYSSLAEQIVAKQKELSGGKTKNDGKEWDFGDNEAKYNHEFNELMSSEIDVPIQEFKLSELQDIKLSASSLLALDYLIKDDSDS